jgi:hypothetical protein
MSLRLVRAVAETENLDEFHLSRLLLLLGSADARKRTPETKARAVEGITKLAKMDFYLRYPTYLERALLRLRSTEVDAIAIEERERTSIETTMIRFRYGPWDARYRRWLGLLHARGLVTLGLRGNTVTIGLTEAGRAISAQLANDPVFESVKRRSGIVAKVLGAMPATKLKDFTYQVVPEITTMKWGDDIPLKG